MNSSIALMANNVLQASHKIEAILERSEGIIQQLKTLEYTLEGNIYFVGNGSSGLSARMAQTLALHCLNKVPLCINPNQFAQHTYKVLTPKDLVIGITQTGTSHFVVESLRLANQAGAETLAITTIADAPIVKVAKLALIFAECREDVDYKVIGVIGQLVALWLTILGIAFHQKRLLESQCLAYIAEMKSLCHHYDRIAHQGAQWVEKHFDYLESFNTIAVLGSGDVVDAAAELAIKSIEVQNRFALAIDIEEYFHGVCAANLKHHLTIVLADAGTAKASLRYFDAIQKRGLNSVYFGPQATEGNLCIEMPVSSYFSHMLLLPLVHSVIATWGKLGDYGESGKEVFDHFQQVLKIRET